MNLEDNNKNQTQSPYQIVESYHERTKCYAHRLLAGPGNANIDWDSQPDPFRRYSGASLVHLPISKRSGEDPFWKVYVEDSIAPAPLTIDSVSLFFRYSLSLTSWKKINETVFSLRVNPSSGNLHPTEGYALLPAVEGIHDGPAVYHYAPKEHGLERRMDINQTSWEELMSAFPAGSFVVGLTSIFWRQSWKYGERSFRFCQEDMGHVLGTMRFAAAALGWKFHLLSWISDVEISKSLGLDREDDFAGAERESPQVLAVVTPCAWNGFEKMEPPQGSFGKIVAKQWYGKANVLSPSRDTDWPGIDEVAAATSSNGIVFEDEFSGFPSEGEVFGMPIRSGSYTAEKVILGRRSAHKMDACTSIPTKTFFGMLGRLIPTCPERQAPWDSIGWRPRVHLGLFVHRVQGLPQGLYALSRDPNKNESLRQIMKKSFLWSTVPSCPVGLPLYLLKEGDYRAVSTKISCAQDMAGDGAFSLALLADYKESLDAFGATFYRNLFWEAGLIGQVLYLEAEEAGLRSSGMGCHLDDSVHEIFGFRSRKWQSFYNFTVGGHVEDSRLITLPAYPRMVEQ